MTLAEVEVGVRRAIDEVAQRLEELEAKAIVLTGSHARGDARPDSDVDLFAIGDGPSEMQYEATGKVVSVHWFDPEAVRGRMQHPASAVIAVKAWRDAAIVSDPHGIARELKREAEEWTWDRIAREADAWVADELVERAEYVSKLRAALGRGDLVDARALAADLALQLGRVSAVERRLLHESENGLWCAIATADGPAWRTAFARALAVHGETVEVSATATIELFRLLADEVRSRLEARQLARIDAALQE